MGSESTAPAPQADARDYARRVDFGRTSADYARFRSGPPASFYDRLSTIIPLRACRTVEVGAGTGLAAIEMASRGATVTALDISEPQIQQARRAAADRSLRIDFRVGRAEETKLPSASFDLYLALQCWHWFDKPKAGAEAFRLLRPGGAMVLASFDYLAGRSDVARRAEDLILKFNPDWPMANGSGCYVGQLFDLPSLGLENIQQCSYEHLQPFTHAAWRGRMRTCNGVGASLPPEQVTAFDAELAALLAREFSTEPLLIPHRVWMAWGFKPQA